MIQIYLLALLVISGAVIGASLALFPESDTDSKLLHPQELIDGGSPVAGNADAAITILEWGDYQCTFCYKFHQNTLNVIKQDFIDTGQVKLVFKDFPLNGPDSILASEASYCAGDQGAYWQYHDELYKNWGGERTGWITRESLNDFASTINLNLDEFNQCLNENKYKNKVNMIYEFGKEIGIDATPSFLVFNDEKIIKIVGNQPLQVFLKSIEEL